ncbi:hypothetical protein BJ912DRAFT_859119, partial [Pholiota molesta]
MPPKGRPAKKKRNISGLRNQPAIPANHLPSIIESGGENTDSNHPISNPDVGEEAVETEEPPQDMKDMASSEREDDSDSDFESEDDSKGFTSTELGKRLALQSWEIEDDPDDQDWIPYNLRRQKGKKKEISLGPSVPDSETSTIAPDVALNDPDQDLMSEHLSDEDIQDQLLNDEDVDPLHQQDAGAMETWEEELEEDVHGHPSEIK